MSKCQSCKGIARYKVLLVDPKTNEKFIGKFCKICWDDIKPDDKFNPLHFSSLDIEGYKPTGGSELMILRRVEKI